MKIHFTFIYKWFTLVALLVAPIGSGVQIIPAGAVGIVVNTNADNTANDGKCTLREAIIAAVSNLRSGTKSGECAAGNAGLDSISFAANYIITVGSQLPYVTTAMTITGKGAANTILQAAAVPDVATWRVLQVTPTGNLTLDGVTVRNGRCINETCTVVGGILPDSGGGIYNTGTVTVTNSVISGNTVTGYGGGIFSTGIFIISNDTISGNTATSGGGISNWNSGTMTVTYSTVSGNAADHDVGQGGGIYNEAYDGNLTVTNSTISGNSASWGGGIMVSIGPVAVINSTISGNIVFNEYNHGGAIYSDSGLPLILQNTIVANSVGDNCWGTVTNNGNNLEDGATCGWGFDNGSMSSTDPMLGPLANNGGPTKTMKLLAGSPAIDAGNASFCSASPVSGVDQRGVNRPLGSGCDIGAFETTNGVGPETVGVFRPSNGVIFLKNLNISGFADLGLNYGLAGDYPVVGDWDGDGDDTIGVYRNGIFLLRNSNSVGFANITVAFGSPGDQPIAGDWNNDGVDTIGVYQSSTGTFLLRNSNTPGPADLTFALGNAGDVGIAGDWNGDGIDTTGVFRPSSGVIFLKNTNSSGFANIALNYGLPGDQPVVGDWDNNGTTTIGIYRNGRFYLRNSNTNGFANIQLDLGNLGDMPIAGNWDGVP